MVRAKTPNEICVDFPHKKEKTPIITVNNEIIFHCAVE